MIEGRLIDRRIEIQTNHPGAEVIARVAAEAIADELDRINVHWSVKVTDVIGTTLHEWGATNGN